MDVDRSGPRRAGPWKGLLRKILRDAKLSTEELYSLLER